MPAVRLSMRKIREVLRLKFDGGQTNRRIARSCHISRPTVADYLLRFEEAGLKWSAAAALDDTTLERKLFAPAPAASTTERAVPDWGEVHRELRRKGVTLTLLWHEYKAAHPEGYQYSWFCDQYRAWAAKLDVVMRQEHRAGEKLFVDYAGQSVEVVDQRTGEIRAAEIFVAVLGASSYTYAEATWTQQLPDWIGSHVRAFAFFGGTSKLLVPDNLRSGVSKAHRYEPDINPTYADLAGHYGVAVLPARVRKPRDKAKAEVGVLLVERWILAALRNRTFFSLAELNREIARLLDRLNARPFKKLPGSRQELFGQIDRPALRPLPAQPYEFAEWKKVRVNIDYCPSRSTVTTTRCRISWSGRAWRPALANVPWSASTRDNGSPAIGAPTSRDATPRWLSTCPPPTANMPSGRRNGSFAGPRRRGRPQPRWRRASSNAAPIPSRAFAPAWASCVWARALAKSVWRQPAGGHSDSVPAATRASSPSCARDSTAGLCPSSRTWI